MMFKMFILSRSVLPTEWKEMVGYQLIWINFEKVYCQILSNGHEV